MNEKRSAALGNAAGGEIAGLGFAPLSRPGIHQIAPRVKSCYNVNLSRALDYAVLGLESARDGGERAYWRAVKRALESRIARGAQ